MDEITINGYIFQVPSPYAVGHVCTKAEADVLNRKLHANLRANFSKEVAERMTRFGGQIESYNLAQMKNDFAEYAASYSFNGPDPVEVEALIIAHGIVRRAIKDKGMNISDYSKAQLAEQAELLLNGNLRGEILRLARDRVTSLQAAAQKELAKIQGEE